MMQNQNKATSSENGKNRAIIPLAVPELSVTSELQVESVDSGLSEENIKEELKQLGEMLGDYVKLGGAIRIKIYGMLERGFHECMNRKPTALLDEIEVDGVSGRHKYRLLQAAINEWEIGIPPNTLLESHSRQLDALESPEDKQLAYEMAVQCASGERQTAKHFEQAVEQVLAINLAKLAAVNDVTKNQLLPAKAEEPNKRYTAISVFESIAKTSSSQKADVFKGVLQSSKDVLAPIEN